MIDKTQQNQHAASLLERRKHVNYQMLPPGIGEVANDLANQTGTSRLDERRYEWFQAKMDHLSGETVIDIGANIGYFSFRTAMELHANVIAYEPYEPHAEALLSIRDLCELSPRQVKIENMGVGLRELENLPEAKMVILLNVIQHAGDDFDLDLVSAVSDWRNYAIEYLKGLSKKARFLFFQMGYTWKGHETALCKDEDVIDFTVELLGEAGWAIRQCGVIKELTKFPVYEDYQPSVQSHNPVFLPPLSKGLFARIGRKIGGSIRGCDFGLYRFAQRPLWICEVEDESGSSCR